MKKTVTTEVMISRKELLDLLKSKGFIEDWDELTQVYFDSDDDDDGESPEQILRVRSVERVEPRGPRK